MNAVKNLLLQIQGHNDKEAVSLLEDIISDDIEKALQDPNFFKLPLKNIFSIVEKIDFGDFSDWVSIPSKLIKGVIDAYPDDDNAVILIKKVNIDSNAIALSDLVTILKNFTNIPLCVALSQLYNEDSQLPDKDYEYELRMKDKQIKELKARSTMSSDRFDTNDIFAACEKGDIESIKYQVGKGAQLEISNAEGLFPIHIACRYDHFTLVHYLYENNVNLEATDSLDRTPLHIACEYGYLPIVKFLIEVAGVREDSRGKNGETPFIVAYNHHRYSIVEYYKEKFQIPVLPKDFEADIHNAAHEGFIESVQYLIEKMGISSEARDWNNSTPLHYACIGGHLNIVQYLIEKQHVNIEAIDNEGKTPLHKASENGKRNVVKYLLSKGANKYALTYNKMTPSDIACEISNATALKEEIQRMLK